MPLQIYVRNDNGSQMESYVVQQYFAGKQVIQNFSKPSKPEQNALIESYHSIIEWLICIKFEHIHSGINYLSLYKYLLSMGIGLMKEIELKKLLQWILRWRILICILSSV